MKKDCCYTQGWSQDEWFQSTVTQVTQAALIKKEFKEIARLTWCQLSFCTMKLWFITCSIFWQNLTGLSPLKREGFSGNKPLYILKVKILRSGKVKSLLKIEKYVLSKNIACIYTKS